MVDPDLDERKQFLLKAIVHDYVETAEPVASRYLVERYHLEVKSATIRNEMAEMVDMGLLRQPHTSAGRIPSDRGYRVYVDRLMPRITPSLAIEDEAGRLRQLLSEEIEEVLRQTCRMLTRLTTYMAVAIPPETRVTALREVHLSPLDGSRCLLVAVTSGETVKHRIVDLGTPMDAAELTRLSHRLTDEIQGATATTVLSGSGSDEATPSRSPEREVRAALCEILEPHDETVTVVGAGQILRQPEFQDVTRLRQLLDVLEERRTVLQLLRTAVNDTDVQVIIGEENSRGELKECSLVAARYSTGAGSHGAIGVIGPTRMTYQTALPIVQLVAGRLSDLFDRWMV